MQGNVANNQKEKPEVANKKNTEINTIPNGQSLIKPDWQVITLPPFEKDFYVAHQNVMTR